MTRIGEPVREPYIEPAPIRIVPFERPITIPERTPEREPELVPSRRVTEPEPLKVLTGEMFYTEELPTETYCPKCGRELKPAETDYGLMFVCPRHLEGYLVEAV